MLLLKQRTANVDQLVKKQEKYEKDDKEQKIEIERLRNECLMKDETIKNLQNQAGANFNSRIEIERLANDNKIKDDIIQEKEGLLESKNVIIQQKEAALDFLRSSKDKEVGAFETRIFDIARNNENNIKAKDEIIHSQIQNIKTLEERIREMEDLLASQQLKQIDQKLVQESKICQKNRLCDKNLLRLNSLERNQNQAAAEDGIIHLPVPQENVAISIFDIDEEVLLEDQKASKTRAKENSTKDGFMSIDVDMVEDPSISSPIFAVKDTLTSTPNPSSKASEFRLPSSPIRDIAAINLSEDDYQNRNAVSGTNDIKLTTNNDLPCNKDKLDIESAQRQISPLTEDQNMSNPSSASLDNLSEKRAVFEILAPELPKVVSNGTSKPSVRLNKGVKFMAPGRKKSFQNRKKSRPKVAKFSICGRLDVNNTSFSYKHDKKPPHDLVIKTDFVPLNANNVLERVEKIEKELLNVKKRLEPISHIEANEMNDVYERVIKRRKIANAEENKTPKNDFICSTKEKVDQNSHFSPPKQFVQIDQAPKQILPNESTKKKSQKISNIYDDETGSKHNKRKRKNDMLFGDTSTGTSADEMCPPKLPAKTVPPSLKVEQVNQKRVVKPSDSHVWTPERFALYDLEQAAAKPSREAANARSRAAAILAKQPLNPVSKQEPKKSQPLAQLADDLSISDSSDQEGSSPVKSRGVPVNKATEIHPNPKPITSIDDPETHISDALALDSNGIYKRPSAYKSKRQNETSSLYTEPAVEVCSSDSESCKLKGAVRSLVKPKIENKNKKDLLLKSKGNVAQNSKNMCSTKSFKHKKFDSAEFIPLGKSHSTLKPGIGRALHSDDNKDIKQQIQKSLETSAPKATVIPCATKIGSNAQIESQCNNVSTKPSSTDSVLQSHPQKRPDFIKFVSAGVQFNSTPLSSEIKNFEAKQDTPLQNHSVASMTPIVEYQNESQILIKQHVPVSNDKVQEKNNDYQEVLQPVPSDSVKVSETNKDRKRLNQEETYLGTMLKSFVNETKGKQRIRQQRKDDIKRGQGLNEEININLIKVQLGR